MERSETKHVATTAESEDAIARSLRVQSAASAEGFDWDHVDGVLAKVAEELEEIRIALVDEDEAHARRELGDLLLITVNLARFLGANPAVELERATRRFETRFAYMKKALTADGKSLKTCSLDALEECWQRIKPEADGIRKKCLDMGPDDEANSEPAVTKTPDSKG